MVRAAERVEILQTIGDVKAGGLYALCYMRVCAVKEATDDEILHVCNTQNPAGTTNGWTQVVRKATGRWPGPVTCADDDNREHLLVLC